MLCERISIDRISEEEYIKFLDNIFKKSWGKTLDKPLLDEIFRLTERHPYYINVLCDKIWTICDKKNPTIGIIRNSWKAYVEQEESKIAKELSFLNTSQKKILIAVSQGFSNGLTSKEILRKFDFTSSAITKSLKLLEEQDYLNKNKNGEYFIVDPLIKASLLLFYKGLY